ncbi:putative DNA helicase [Hibiscus syriacus]|uniref:DNA helicase n=1 Tax=Hibiscus syriacus TaxID=106335 RepID=A0A6A2ZKF5_HIBSY|nr:putative DNA helicase [Hibiscus syriacus]
MVFSHRKNLFTTLLVFSLLVASVQLGAMRLLNGEQLAAKDKLVVQSLPRGPVKGSGHSPCTNIPGRETGVCKLGGMNIAGNAMHSSTAFPSVVAEFGVASTATGARDQDMT